MRQVADYVSEVHVLAELLERFSPDQFGIPTQFKGWTAEDVVGHLHMFDLAALGSLRDGRGLDGPVAPVVEAIAAGKSPLASQRAWLDGLGLSGGELVAKWRQTTDRVAEAYSEADPKSRLEWAGPSMSARSMVTARQMETWAHGQALFDLAGEIRPESDRVRNIAHMGVTTYGWSFAVRGEDPPSPPPLVELEGPSGARWTWNGDSGAESSVRGMATEFAQVVAQVRNVADTSLVASGAAAEAWMERAQCFAGAPSDPPARGTRFRLPAPFGGPE